MDRLELIVELEGRMAPAPGNKFYHVRDGFLWTPMGAFKLLNMGIGRLEIMLKYSKWPWKTAEQMTKEDPNLWPEDAVCYEKASREEWEAFDVAERIFDTDDTLTQDEVALAYCYGFVESDIDVDGTYPTPTDKYNNWVEDVYQV